MEWEISEMFKALAVETRVRILELLKTQGPLGAKEIARLTGITAAAASQHLKILKQAGLVRSERQGYWIPYAVNPEVLEEYRRRLSEVCTCGCRGSGHWQEKERRETPLDSLKQYEQDLQNELENVRQRIKELKSK
ncbi:MAG: metalloregulator ArsR/SmtB family transcription factor [Deltaproteobacteria bacterium]|nr:metalloregulator ArsR/SmtB family transcription factor [Deltaproteobacteria bacterium]